MKTNIIGVIIALALAFAGVICAWGQDNKVSEVRKVEAFSSIRITSVGTVLLHHRATATPYRLKDGRST